MNSAEMRSMRREAPAVKPAAIPQRIHGVWGVLRLDGVWHTTRRVNLCGDWVLHERHASRVEATRSAWAKAARVPRDETDLAGHGGRFR